MPLTHCSLVTPYVEINESTLAQIIACCLTAPSNYLNQCSTSHQWVSVAFTWEQFIVSAQAIILYREFENYTFKIIATFPRGQWVNTGNASHADISTEEWWGSTGPTKLQNQWCILKSHVPKFGHFILAYVRRTMLCFLQPGNIEENIIISYLTAPHIQKYYC